LPQPRLRTGFFSLLDSRRGRTQDTKIEAPTSTDVKGRGRPWPLTSPLPRVDLTVVGSVAVDPVSGARIGKGEGFAVLEYAMLRALGVIDATAPVVTTGGRAGVAQHGLKRFPDFASRRARGRDHDPHADNADPGGAALAGTLGDLLGAAFPGKIGLDSVFAGWFEGARRGGKEGRKGGRQGGREVMPPTCACVPPGPVLLSECMYSKPRFSLPWRQYSQSPDRGYSPTRLARPRRLRS
jgi:hypothetical protein